MTTSVPCVAGDFSWVISHVPIFHITQPLGIWSIMIYNGYYKVMSNIPKMGHLPTPVFEGIDMGLSWGIDGRHHGLTG